jgi:hypothetical protein
MWATGGDITIHVQFSSTGLECPQILSQTFELFVRLAQTGALAGRSIEPWESGLTLESIQTKDGSMRLKLLGCRVDAGSLYVLLNLLLPHHEILGISSIDVIGHGALPTEQISVDLDDESIYPGIYERLPFEFIDEEPESGAYTFQARCSARVSEQDIEPLAIALNTWVEVVLAGGYEMSSIAPIDSYVEPSEDGLIAFGSMLEWTIFKLRADPESTNGIVNIFAVFHNRMLPLVTLEII